MRPARKGPENRTTVLRYSLWTTGFNEAGPQGAGKPHVGDVDAARDAWASMRPARKGPENRAPHHALPLGRRRFNEAGPQGAGKPAASAASAGGCGSFNEAGPQGAGKPKAPALLRAIEAELQ